MIVPASARVARVAPLAASLSMALALGSTPIQSLATDRVVQNCGDGGAGSGSLRDMVGTAVSGDLIDLRQLPTKCGMTHSTVTLTNGEIVMNQQDLTLQGPDAGAGSVSIVLGPGNTTRVLSHTGFGQLSINALTIANGNLQVGANTADGGCIKSNGSIFVAGSAVTGCTAEGIGAKGGGIYAYGSLTLVASTVSGNNAIASIWGSGGGVFARNGLAVKYSTLSNNYASTFGGGAYTSSATPGVDTFILDSTIEGNAAEHCGDGTLYTSSGVTISDSTISGNTGASLETGGVGVEGEVAISNSTIAFNVGDGVAVWGSPSSLTLQSSIVAENVLTPGTYDLNIEFPTTTTISGADNLVMTSSVILWGVVTVTSDPKLGPLQFNGGWTRTHALLPGSPAIGTGNNTAGFATDQRGHGYPRMGPNANTDIGAYQFDSIFAHDFEF